ncbi:MAG: TSUP family transporter [Magnetovibrionaceae bacterium]
MTIEYLTILAVVGLFSVVQSFFGMGLLVFGTPTMLMMGYDFTTTLGHLLPASFAVSLLQVLTAGNNRAPVSKYLYILCLPGICLGLWLTEKGPLESFTTVLVGGMLLISALIRFSAPLRTSITKALARYAAVYHLLMGIIHGLTNLGGALLAVLAGGLHDEKHYIRYTIAHYYLFFALMQMIVLVFIDAHALSPLSLMNAATSGIVYLLIGNRIFKIANNPVFNHSLTVFLAAYGIAVLSKL